MKMVENYTKENRKNYYFSFPKTCLHIKGTKKRAAKVPILSPPMMAITKVNKINHSQNLLENSKKIKVALG